MAKDQTLYAVSKGNSDSYFGEADAGQIARSGGKLKLFDAAKAEVIKNTSKIAEEAAKIEKQAEKVEAIKASGGSDASAIRKGPPKV
tara:strand:+ start:2713 stop:2973 length:261 start_codon:yes stop_codon:yes gene_type:complete